MSPLATRLVDLARLSLQDPRAGARAVLAEGVPLPARTAGLLLMAVASAVLLHLGFLLMPPSEAVLDQFMVQSPIRTAIVQWVILVVSIFLVYRVGRAWGGRGSLSDTLLIVVWLQVIMLGVQLLQLLLMVVAPPLGAMVSLAGFVLFFWLFTSFIAELHGFASRWAVLAGILGTSLALAFLAAAVIALTLGPEALQNV
jgi:hypothetical protein